MCPCLQNAEGIGSTASGTTKPPQSETMVSTQPSIKNLQTRLRCLASRWSRELAKIAEEQAGRLIEGMKTAEELTLSCDEILQLEGCEPAEIQQRLRSVLLCVDRLRGTWRKQQ